VQHQSVSSHPVPHPARELSPEEHAERVEACRALDQQVKAGLRAGREALWRLAKALHEFDEENGWTALGFAKKDDWLAHPDVDLSYDQFQRLVRVYRETARRQADFVALQTTDLSKVDLVLPAVKEQRVSLDDALEHARTLSWRELRAEYKPPKPKPKQIAAAAGTVAPAPPRPTTLGTDPLAGRSKDATERPAAVTEAPPLEPSPFVASGLPRTATEPTTGGGGPQTVDEALALADRTLQRSGDGPEPVKSRETLGRRI